MDIPSLYQLFLKSSGVCTDTRQITTGVIFFALKGANFNGNKFAEDALKSGASFAVIDEEQYKKDERFVLVKDALTALQELANYHRKQFSIPFLAITGSNGKTTTKELINAVLSKKYKTYATKGNLNNHIGIPLTILAIQKDAEMAIVEMGANHQKEIEGYCKIAEPTHGVITNIGKAHLEGFGGIEGVKKGKGELYDYLLKSDGTAFINSDNETLMGMQKFKQPILYPKPGNYYSCRLKETDPFIVFTAENGDEVRTNLIGAYNFDNIAVALCIGKFFGVPEKDANQAVASYTPDNNRSQIIKAGDKSIILDAYNANPSSMKAAIENFDRLKGNKKAVILGDMFELGDESEQEHARLGELIKQCKFDKVFLCGKHMVAATKALPGASYFTSRPELEEALKNQNLSGYELLIKGSRGMGLERLLDILK